MKIGFHVDWENCASALFYENERRTGCRVALAFRLLLDMRAGLPQSPAPRTPKEKLPPLNRVRRMCMPPAQYRLDQRTDPFTDPVLQNGAPPKPFVQLLLTLPEILEVETPMPPCCHAPCGRAALQACSRSMSLACRYTQRQSPNLQ